MNARRHWNLAVLVFLFVCHLYADQDTNETELVVGPCDGLGNVLLARVSTTGIRTNNLFGDRQVRKIFVNRSGALISLGELDGRRVMLYPDTVDHKTLSAVADATNLPENVRGELSPDGKQLCFLHELGWKDAIRVLNLGDGKIDEVFAVAGKASPPAWSPDGTGIAYYFAESRDVRQDGYKVGVSKKRRDKWEHQAITTASAPAQRTCLRCVAPTWSSDGTVVVFEGRYAENEKGPQTYMVRVAEQQLVRIGGYPFGASFAPGGVVFAHLATTNSFDTDVCLLDTATGKSRKIMGGKIMGSPRISPDGHWIAYSDESGCVYVTALATFLPRRVVDTGAGVLVDTFYWIPRTRNLRLR